MQTSGGTKSGHKSPRSLSFGSTADLYHKQSTNSFIIRFQLVISPVIYIHELCHEPPRPEITDKRASWVSTSPMRDASQGFLLYDTGKTLLIKSPVPSIRKQ